MTVGLNITPAVPLFFQCTQRVPPVDHSSKIWILDPEGESGSGTALIRDQWFPSKIQVNHHQAFWPGARYMVPHSLKSTSTLILFSFLFRKQAISQHPLRVMQ